jgi:trehalose 6-phosphate phosphatase
MAQKTGLNCRNMRREQFIEISHVPDFWSRVSAARSKFLGLDYDGTLAPFEIEHMEAYPLDGIRGLLYELSEVNDSTLAIISGRPIRELIALVGELKIYFAGSHGYELRYPDGRLHRRHPRPHQKRGLLRARQKGVSLGFTEKMEVKIASIALHTRGIPAPQAASMEREISEEWFGIAHRYDLELRRFNGGIEMRAAGWNKGDIVGQILSLHASDTLPVYIGDDETDEDVFTMIRDRGIGIRVGFSAGTSAAQGGLPNCEAVRKFLETWLFLSHR